MEQIFKAQLATHLNAVLSAKNVSNEQQISVETYVLVLMETKTFLSSTMAVAFPGIASHIDDLTKIYAIEYLKNKTGIDIAMALSNKPITGFISIGDLTDVIIKSIAITDEHERSAAPSPSQDIPTSPSISTPPKPKTDKSSKFKRILQLKKSTDDVPKSLTNDRLQLD